MEMKLLTTTVMSRLVSAFLATLVASTASAQQLPSYGERPPDAAGVFAIWPGSGVPPGSEKWLAASAKHNVRMNTGTAKISGAQSEKGPRSLYDS